MDITLSAPSFCRQISPEEFEYQRAYGSQEPLAALLEEVITDAKLSSKEKKKKLKQVKGVFFLSHFFSLLFLCCFFLFILCFKRFHMNLIFWDRAVLKVLLFVSCITLHNCGQFSRSLVSTVDLLPLLRSSFMRLFSNICPWVWYVVWCEFIVSPLGGGHH